MKLNYSVSVVYCRMLKWFSCPVVFLCSRSYSYGSSKKLLEILADMPKSNSSRIVEAQRQRQQIAKKSEKYGPSTVYLQVLGSGAKGAPNTLYLFTDQKRYLFNCGESTQRLAYEHKVRLSRLDHIFITSKTWANIGGLPGLSLTLQDVGVPNITLHGPEGLDELYKATKRFVIMKDMNVTMATCSPSADFEDSVMNVKYVLLGQPDNLLTPEALRHSTKNPKHDNDNEKEYEEFINDETDYYRSEKYKEPVPKDKAKLKPSAEKGDSMKKKTEKVLHELQKKTNCSVAYICTLKKRPGTLDLAKCVELGVKPGPLLGQLKNGQDVVLPDGSLVLSKDVKTPDDPGPVFIVLEVADPSYLKESDFQAYFDNEENPPENVPTLIVHFTPPHVFHHPTYRMFISKFGASTRHLVLNEHNSCLGSEAVHRTQHKLHLLDPDIFPLLRDASVLALWHATPPAPRSTSPLLVKGLEELKNKIALAQFQNIINLEGAYKGDAQVTLEDVDSTTKLELLAGRTLTIFHLRPKRQLDRSMEPKLHIQDYIQETMDVDGFVDSLQQFRHLVESMRYAKTDTKEYPKVVFLGTGSSIPSKTRNTSAFVVHIDEDRSMLMDCGEGTFCQLVRFYGSKKVNAFLRSLKAIYISHLHADHHIGLIGVLQARRRAFEEAPDQQYVPVYLLAPGQIVAWLNLYDQQFERIKTDYTLIANQSLLNEATAPNPELTAAVLSAIGVQSIQTCLVAHCPNAFGVAIQMNQHHKLTYSGDTIPCEELVKIGENSTLLIHEATMEDELAAEARIKMHSTTTQAIEIGRQMNARYTVLTHFSQRYARLPRLNANILNDNHSVGIAFDNMQVTMSDLELLPHMYAPLQLMFAEHCVEMELKAAQRQRGREKRASSPTAPPTTRAPKRPREPAANTDSPTEVCKGSQRSATKRSSNCQSACLPSPRVSYRESNSSRLRQEMKGMAITGIIGKAPRSRSSSSSAATSATKQRSVSLSPQKLQSCNHATSWSAKDKTPPDPSSSTTSRTSASSNMRNTLERPKTTSRTVIDTRSKTLNTVSQPCPVFDMMAKTGRRPAIPDRTPLSTPVSRDNYYNAYGKPLVTSFTKKLTIRKDTLYTPRSSIVSKEKVAPVSPVIHTKPSPASWRGPNSRDVSPLVRGLRSKELGSIKMPTKGTVSENKLRATNTSPVVLPDTKIPVMKNSFGTKLSKPSALSTNQFTINKTYKAKDAAKKSFSTNPNDASNELKIKSTLNKEPFHATRTSTIMRSSIKDYKPQLEDIKSSYLLLNDDTEDVNTKFSNEKAGLAMHSNAFSRLMYYQFNYHSLKGILSKKKFDPVQFLTRPRPIDEELRRQQLLKVKNKFQSKHFWNECKYEKIEGLNWISWK